MSGKVTQFSCRMVYARKSVGMSRLELSEQLHVTISTIGGWETGRCEPSIAAIRKMCEIFGCTSDYLLGVERANEAAAPYTVLLRRRHSCVSKPGV